MSAIYTDASDFWRTIVDAVQPLRCWTRAHARFESEYDTGDWGTLLLMPTSAYVESSIGPVSIKDLKWVQIATSRPHIFPDGSATFDDLEDEIVRALESVGMRFPIMATTLARRGSRWPIRALHIENRYFES